LAHGSPDQLNPFNYVDTDESAFDYVFSKFPELRKTIAPKNLGIIFVGHSHIPAYFYINKSIKNPKETDVHAPTLYGTCSLNLDIKSNHIISCGSVGQPRDEDPRACYVTFDSEKRKINFHRVEYDVGIVQAQMLRAGLPSRLAHRLEHGY
jgi:diadenosine tetraphosphatase ApaH/serine/threonine PP2A family protein phosphatase